MSRSLSILARVQGYPPDVCAGAELALHEMLRYLQDVGYYVEVQADSASAQSFDGVPISAPAPLSRRFDAVITHLDATPAALAENEGCLPLVVIVHYPGQLEQNNTHPADVDLVVFNSEWVSAKCRLPRPSLVVRPVVRPERYLTLPGECITLVNLCENKGAPLFWELAALMPDRLFLGVRGGYADQIVPASLPPNVEVIDHTPDMKSVYSRTRILLIPSREETWGRVGIEAAVSGIPSIAHPTQGLIESLGHAGLFVDRDDPAAWVAAILALEDPATYRAQALAARKRAAELSTTADLARFEKELRSLLS